MYRYDEFDHTLVAERVATFRRQVARRLAGDLTEDQFKPLRLMNGLYLQLHAYMLRINVPYGCLSSRQLRKLAFIARRYDRGFGHFTTRQNIQFNWIRLDETPDMLAELAEVEMNAMQSSGNCVRNITADQFAGRARDEIEDPRPWCELIRQWSILHPEFSYLPRKFKIAVTGAARRPGGREVPRRRPVPAPQCRRRDRLRSHRGRRTGTHALRRPHHPRVAGQGGPALLPGSDTAHLQPGRPARQPQQGPHQDPGERARHRRVPASGRRGMGADQGQPAAQR